MAKLKTYSVAEYPKIEDPFTQFFQNTSTSMMDKKMASDLGIFYTYYKSLQAGLSVQGFQMRLPFQISIQ